MKTTTACGSPKGTREKLPDGRVAGTAGEGKRIKNGVMEGWTAAGVCVQVSVI
jgi:hypothetical protein